MDSLVILAEYEERLVMLREAVEGEEWDRLDGLQDQIDALRVEFSHLPQAEKETEDVQSQLRVLLALQDPLLRHMAEAQDKARQNLRQFKTAQTQRSGYQPSDRASLPPVYVDRRS